MPLGGRRFAMFWIGFGIGMLCGCVAGVFVVALCQVAAAADRKAGYDEGGISPDFTPKFIGRDTFPEK
jgi:hypothetical protein